MIMRYKVKYQQMSTNVIKSLMFLYNILVRKLRLICVPEVPEVEK